MTAQTPPPDFVAQIVHLDGNVVVVVAGEIDMASAPALEATLNEAVDQSSRLTIDMHGVEFMDSSGLGVLVRIVKRCASSGGVVTLLRVRAMPLRLLELTLVDKEVAIELDELDLSEQTEGAV